MELGRGHLFVNMSCYKKIDINLFVKTTVHQIYDYKKNVGYYFVQCLFF